VHYTTNRNARYESANHYVVALNGINFDWTTRQSPRGQFEVKFAELEEFDNKHGTISFLGEDNNTFPKLATWTAYTKITAINMLNKEDMNSVFTLVHIKKLVDICLVPQYFYMYVQGEDKCEDVDADEAAAAIWSGGTGKEQHQGDDEDAIEEEQQPVDEEQQPVQPVEEDQEQGDDEDHDMEDDDEVNDEDTTEDNTWTTMIVNYHKPSALNMDGI
jgi:hypothetical protein